MCKALTVVMAAALVAALFVGTTATAGKRAQGDRDANRQGVMPEVVIRAEMPRLVMPAVEVHAFRTVALSGTAGNVY